MKVYGISFGGAPRSEKAANAREVPKPMVIAMAVLALCCVLLGVGASVVTPIIAKISTALAHSEPLMLAQNGVVVAQAEPHTALSTPMVTIMLLAFFFLPFSFLRLHQKSTFIRSCER